MSATQSLSSSESADVFPYAAAAAANHDEGVGLSDPRHSRRSRQLLDLVNKLHNTGVQVDIDLPQIAVIGAQSAGKSSLIESISGITLPRASGTCTRCPTECRLAYSTEPWQCAVYLRWIVDKNGQPRGQVDMHSFGAVIYDKAEVEDRIKRAQRAILNPSTTAQQFLDSYVPDIMSELTFSKNCVCLQISGPDVADLSFCDLPGLIASAGTGGTPSDINLIRSLAESYVSKPSCVILLTVACETDFQNQGAHELAKAMDPEGKRTVGVLTKPDRIPHGDEQTWISLIKNEKEFLLNNWFCVKQPSYNDLLRGITWSEARENEDNFFSSTEPWSSLDPLYQKYLRTRNLVERLSTILSDLISKRLPEIQQELRSSIQGTEDALSKLPKAPSNDPSLEIMTMLHDFSNDLAKHVQGTSDMDGLLQQIRPHQEKFRLTIRKTAPNFRPYEREFQDERCLAPSTFLRNEGEEDEGSNYEATQHAGAPAVASTQDVIYVDEVFVRAETARTRELPGNHPFAVQEYYIREFTSTWLVPSLQLCSAVHSIVYDHVLKLIRKHFGTYGQGLLDHRIRLLVQNHLEDRFHEARTKVTWLLQLDQHPFTSNTHYLADYKDKFMSHFKASRQDDMFGDIMASVSQYRSTPNPQVAQDVHTILSRLATLGFEGVGTKDLAKLLPDDEMQPALKIMAEVRAYFQVAYKRVTDMIPMAIDHELVRGAANDMLKILSLGLQIQGPDGKAICKEFARESPQDAGRREELNKKLERLRNASAELLNVA